jgi:hypothetical protein
MQVSWSGLQPVRSLNISFEENERIRVFFRTSLWTIRSTMRYIVGGCCAEHGSGRSWPPPGSTAGQR